MIAATCFLAAIAVAAALGLARAAHRIEAAGLGRFTVEMIDPDPRRLEATAGRLLGRLRSNTDIATAARVPRNEIVALLTPSLGPAMDGLPLPALIDVTLRPGAAEARLDALVREQAGAQLIRAADGLAPLARMVGTLRRLAWAMVAVASIVTILIAILAARMTLEAHGATLATLHALGATDRELATLVQRRTGRDALAGGLAGLGGGGLTIWIVRARLAALDPTIPALPSGIGDTLVLALVPLVLAGAATIATRLAVLATLRRAP